MVKYSSDLKQLILQQYSPNRHGFGFHSLATRYKIKGGAQIIKNWYDRWDGTINSLERRAGSGCTTLMNSREMKQYIATPIRQKNKKHQAIHYSTLYQKVKTKFKKQIALRTIQHYGKKRLGVKSKRTKKHSTLECT
jgi:hypothetical protein